MLSLAASSSLWSGRGSWSVSDLLPGRRFLGQCGLNACTGGPRVLRVSLMAALGIDFRGQFYFEVWSEPANGHPKSSRVHCTSSNRPVDLGAEDLELDWHGDERELVIQLVEYGRGNQSKDLPVAELRVPRKSVQRYCTEAAEAGGDHRFGKRTFLMDQLTKQEALQRKRRFQEMLLPSGLASTIFTRLGEEQGVHIPTSAEVDKLHEENKRLRQENSELWAKSGLPGGAPIASAAAAAAGRVDGPTVALRFEMVSRNSEFEIAGPIRTASFQEFTA